MRKLFDVQLALGAVPIEKVSLPGLTPGSTIETPITDLNERAIMLDEETPLLGLFMVKVLQEARQQEGWAESFPFSPPCASTAHASIRWPAHISVAKVIEAVHAVNILPT